MQQLTEEKSGSNRGTIIFIVVILLQSINSFAQIDYRAGNRVDSLRATCIGQYSSNNFKECIPTATALLTVDSNAIDLYAIRGLSYEEVAFKLSGNLKTQADTMNYINVLHLAKNDMEKFSLLTTPEKDKNNFMGDIKYKLQSVNQKLTKFEKH